MPPVTTTQRALEYKAELEAIDPNVTYLMTLYLSPDLTPEEIMLRLWTSDLSGAPPSFP